jgi:putative membrane protein
MEILISWILSTLVILVVSYLLPGVLLTGFVSALIVSLVLGLVNAFIKPFLVLITLPINILTLGLFTLVINALLIMLVSYLVPGFKVDGFWWALIFSVTLSITSWLLSLLFA